MYERAWERQLANALSADGREPALLLVAGAAGMGKSSLVRRLLASPGARAAQRLVVSFRAAGDVMASEPDAPGGQLGAGTSDPAGTAVRAPVRRTPAPPATAPPATGLPATVRPATGLGDAAATGAAGMEATAYEALEALEDLHVSFAAGSPLLLVAEDVHHADSRSLELLRGLLHDPPEPFAAVLTYRPGQLAQPGLPLGRSVDYPARLSLTRWELEPLDERQVRDAAAESLGARRCPREFVERLRRLSGGVPQVVADLLRTVRDAGGDREHFTAKDVDDAGVPVRLAEAVLAATAALPERHRAVVRAAAVLGEPACARDLAAVAGLDDEEAHAALVAALERSALRETDEGRYGFCVPLEARAVSRELPGPVRERLHLRAAAVLAAREPVPWARVARHWRGCGRTEDWLRAAERVAEGEAGVSEDEAAVALLEQVLGDGGLPPEKRGRLALALARGAMLGLRSDRTAQVLRRIVEDPAMPAAARGEIRLELGLLLHNQKRRFHEGRAEVRRAAAELAQRPALATLAMTALANPYFAGPTLEENLNWLERAQEAADASRDRTALTAAAACRATLLMTSGDPAAWRLVEQLPRNSPDRAVRQQVARGLCNSANGAVFLGHHRRAGELLTHGLDLAARSGAPFLERVGCGTGLFRDWLTGRWDGLAERCTGLVAEDGVANDARVVLAMLALAKGEWATAHNWLPPDGPEASDGCEVPVAATAAGARIRLLLAGQDAGSAAEAAASAWEWLARKGVWVWGAELAPHAVEAHVHADRRESARELTAEFAAGLSGRDSPAASAALLWCRAVLAEADGDVTEAHARFREAGAAYARLPQPYARALMTEGAGRTAFLLGSGVEAAAAELTSCVEELTALGAAWDAARVRAVLRAHHPAARRRPPGRPSYAQRMSPREAEVAELAATGLTNRQIAATLHLSPRTVEQHVARAMRKLGISSRQGLAEAAPRLRSGRAEGAHARTV